MTGDLAFIVAVVQGLRPQTAGQWVVWLVVHAVLNDLGSPPFHMSQWVGLLILFHHEDTIHFAHNWNAARAER